VALFLVAFSLTKLKMAAAAEEMFSG